MLRLLKLLEQLALLLMWLPRTCGYTEPHLATGEKSNRSPPACTWMLPLALASQVLLVISTTLSLVLKLLCLQRESLSLMSVGSIRRHTIYPPSFLLGTLVALSSAPLSLAPKLTGTPRLLVGLLRMLTLQRPHHSLRQCRT